MDILKIMERLNALKGIPLLDTSGFVYLLKGYDVKTAEVRKFWPWQDGECKGYIANITVTSEDEQDIIHMFTHKATKGVLWRVNHLIADRNRYLKMLRQLSRMGYTLKKK